MADGLNNIGRESNVNELWEIYKKVHNKLYAEAEEEKRRFEIFIDSVNKIIEHNEKHARGEVTFKMGINKFADLLPEERTRGFQPT